MQSDGEQRGHQGVSSLSAFALLNGFFFSTKALRKRDSSGVRGWKNEGKMGDWSDEALT